MIRLLLFIVICFAVVVFTSYLSTLYMDHDEIKQTSYKEYETAHKISLLWFDRNAVGSCSICRMDDMPVFQTLLLGYTCVWCAELNNLTYHLNYHGHRAKIKDARYA